jgi:hypothetical protein
MLYDVRDVDFAAIDRRLLEGFIQQSAGRTDKRMPRAVFLESRLLADEQDLGIR